MRIGLGSGSYIKKKAVESAFPDSTQIACFTFESCVSEQPVGLEETQKGAQFRAEVARDKFKEGDLWIGIENGIVKKKDSANIYADWVDVACIVLITNQGTWVQWSEELSIPTNQMKKCIREEDKTVFRVWSMLKDPHTKFTNGTKPREIFLKNGLLAIKPELKY